MCGRVDRRLDRGARSSDERITDFEHAFEADRPVYRDGLAQRVLGEDDFHPCRLAVFHSIGLYGPYGQITPCRAAISCQSREACVPGAPIPVTSTASP